MRPARFSLWTALAALAVCLVAGPAVAHAPGKGRWQRPIHVWANTFQTNDAGSGIAVQALPGLYLKGSVSLPRAGPHLERLFHRFNQYLDDPQGPFDPDDGLVHMSGERVAVDFVADGGDGAALLAQLQAFGLQNGRVRGKVVSGLLPAGAIQQSAGASGLRFMRPAMWMTHAGATTTQGDAAMLADAARQAYGVDGSGVKVGVLSDSYDCLGGAADDTASGDLPAGGVEVVEDLTSDCSDEGRAMLQIVHDVAPGAELAFATAKGGEATFASNIQALADAGCGVIVDDVLYLAEPMFQDGIVAQAVDQVHSQGVHYYSSAGNAARLSYDAAYQASDQNLYAGQDLGEMHDFDPGSGTDYFQQITIPAGASVTIALQWDDPFYSVSGVGADTDVDMFLIDGDITTLLAGSVTENIGGDPFEAISYTNSGSDTTFNLAITHYSGPYAGRIKYVIFSSSSASTSIDDFATDSGTLYGHANAAGAIAVGAARYTRTPAFGTDPAEIEYFSAGGGVPILFAADGSELAKAEVRAKPEIVAPDGGNTTFFGADTDGDGYPNFFGTSASAPHAAAAGALLLQLHPDLTPTEALLVLSATASDMDDDLTTGFDTGFDYLTGYGLIQLPAAAELVIGWAEPVPALGLAGSMALVAGLILLVRRKV